MVDFTKKIRNSSKFLQSAKFFLEHGVYTLAPRGTTDYNTFWDRETDRYLNGYDIGTLYYRLEDITGSAQSLSSTYNSMGINLVNAYINLEENTTGSPKEYKFKVVRYSDNTYVIFTLILEA